ncbi:4'-phosphopantetheinyl transferase family protein [Lysinibacillus sp. NPDC096418]|uniref:4'-phosphopantetheinyl transferase family protein n=1 Tax=Lysinibacillus sp. NPDC096418 TaxID=3364138 RepID=UPI00380A2D49
MMEEIDSRKNGIHLFALNIGPRLLKWESDAFLLKLPFEDQYIISRYKHWSDRQRALLAKVLIRWVIRKLTFVNHIQIDRNETGRPYLVNDEHWSGDFNLSHSGDWIIAALTNKGYVGVDVEKIHYVDEDVMAYALSVAELQLVNLKPKQDRLVLFYELWTMKEAIYKTGLFPNTTPKSLDTIQLLSNCKDIYTQRFYIDHNHPVSLCYNVEHPVVQLTTLNRNQLIE